MDTTQITAMMYVVGVVPREKVSFASCLSHAERVAEVFICPDSAIDSLAIFDGIL